MPVKAAIAVAGAAAAAATSVFLFYKVARERSDDDSDSEPAEEPHLDPVDPYNDSSEYLIPSAKKTDQVVAETLTPEQIDENLRQQQEQQQIVAALLQKVDKPMEFNLWTSVELVPNPTSPTNDVVESDEPPTKLPMSEIVRRMEGKTGQWYQLGPFLAIFDDSTMKFTVARVVDEGSIHNPDFAPLYWTRRQSVPPKNYTKYEIGALMTNLRTQANSGSETRDYVVLHEAGPFNIGMALFETKDARIVDGVARGSTTRRKAFVFRYTNFNGFPAVEDQV
eukprot:jgi/Mesvir1/26913/Mv20640-RA.1